MLRYEQENQNKTLLFGALEDVTTGKKNPGKSKLARLHSNKQGLEWQISERQK